MRVLDTLQIHEFFWLKLSGRLDLISYLTCYKFSRFSVLISVQFQNCLFTFFTPQCYFQCHTYLQVIFGYFENALVTFYSESPKFNTEQLKLSFENWLQNSDFNNFPIKLTTKQNHGQLALPPYSHSHRTQNLSRWIRLSVQIVVVSSLFPCDCQLCCYVLLIVLRLFGTWSGIYNHPRHVGRLLQDPSTPNLEKILRGTFEHGVSVPMPDWHRPRHIWIPISRSIFYHTDDTIRHDFSLRIRTDWTPRNGTWLLEVQAYLQRLLVPYWHGMLNIDEYFHIENTKEEK